MSNEKARAPAAPSHEPTVDAVTRGLERFGEAVLDFSGVTEVGQGFVDEVFRVWARAHPETKLTPVKMSREVGFMVRRGLGRR